MNKVRLTRTKFFLYKDDSNDSYDYFLPLLRNCDKMEERLTLSFTFSGDFFSPSHIG